METHVVLHTVEVIGLQIYHLFQLQSKVVLPSWANFELRIMTNNRFYINSMGQGYAGYTLVLFNCSGTASSTSYWLGTWYAQDGTQFTMNYLTLTRRA